MPNSKIHSLGRLGYIYFLRVTRVTIWYGPEKKDEGDYGNGREASQCTGSTGTFLPLSGSADCSHYTLIFVQRAQRRAQNILGGTLLTRELEKDQTTPAELKND